MAFQFGVGTLQISATGQIFSIGKIQNVKLDISYENAQLRGTTDVFPTDTQFFNGKAEGSFEYGSIELSQIGYILAGSGAFAGAAGSGTLTISGLAKPHHVQMVFSGVTNGITGTWKLQKVYVPKLSLDWKRTDYLLPSMDFICDSTGGAGGANVLTFQM